MKSEWITSIDWKPTDEFRFEDVRESLKQADVILAFDRRTGLTAVLFSGKMLKAAPETAGAHGSSWVLPRTLLFSYDSFTSQLKDINSVVRSLKRDQE